MVIVKLELLSDLQAQYSLNSVKPMHLLACCKKYSLNNLTSKLRNGGEHVEVIPL